MIHRYGPRGHNTLHQDIYGEVAFPFQAVTLLSREGSFSGGEFVLIEQRLRAQSRAHVIQLERGAFLIFPTRERPVLGRRGYYRTQVRHGVATVRAGERTTLGVISTTPSSAHTSFGTLPLIVSITRIALCPKSAV